MGFLTVSILLLLTIPRICLAYPQERSSQCFKYIKYSLKQFHKHTLEQRSKSARHNNLPRYHCLLITLILGTSVTNYQQDFYRKELLLLRKAHGTCNVMPSSCWSLSSPALVSNSYGNAYSYK